MSTEPAAPTVTTSRRATRGEAAGLLRLTLKLDAVVTGANGLAYLVAAAALEDLLGLSLALQRGVGGFLVVFAALVWVAATRPVIARPAVGAVIAANLAWAAGSVLVAVLGAGSPTTAGTVWILLQAVVVAGFAGMQRYALGRTA
jgi:hypothetical protein